MRRRLAVTLQLFLALTFAHAGENVPSEKRNLVGYYAAWNVHARAYFPKTVDQTGVAAKLTHLNYAFANISPDLRVQLGDTSADIRMKYSAENSVDGVADSDAPNQLRGTFNQLRKLKAKHPHLKILISVGGYSWSSRFSDAALTPETRKAFAASCVELYIQGRFAPGLHAPGIFDGIDIDWEYPGAAGASKNFRAEDTPNFTALLAELRAQLDAQGIVDNQRYLLTIATSASPGTFAKLELDRIHTHLDFINVMTYDFAGAWSNQTGFHSNLFAAQGHSCDATMRGYLKAGVPPPKLNLGVPFYGRGWSGVDPGPNGDGLFQKAAGGAPIAGSTEKGYADYRLLKQLEPAFKAFHHEPTKALSLYNPDSKIFWAFDDPQVLAAKTDYIKTNNLGGAMIWELGGDDDNATLLNTLHKGLSPRP